MTEAIGGEKQIVGLFFPVLSFGANKDDLVLYAGSKAITLFTTYRIDLKNGALTRGSGADRLG